ncbi:hypothetical protein [Marinifilum caeruleilacunae]|uniref:Uncharacterized protein n=1 Tax=Marinifilum caeruleilacunae TaxID=2499076 RepID=A0ABX1X179_9BACT|nr:hypothetical protein [Marinifilum caeruleilacunae]NOU62042.1 hypothetical protein [Marinifilum caeruleilacunae]
MISKSRFLIPLLCGLLAITAQSCFDSDDYDMDRLSDKVEWTPNMIAPVGYGTYSLWYLLNEHELDPNDQTIFLEGNDLVIRHREDDIFTYDASSVLSFPNQLSQGFALPLPPVGLPGPIPIPVQNDTYRISTGFAGVILSQVDVDANLQFTFDNPLNADISLDISLPNGTIGGALATQNFTIPANTNGHVENFDLTGLSLTFPTPSSDNEVALQFEGEILDNGGVISGTGALAIQYQIQNINFQLAYGDFGQQSIDIGTGNIDMDVDFWDDIDGEYRFSNPKIHVHLRNSVGVPFAINANITGYSSSGGSQALNPLPLQPNNYPKTLADVLDAPNLETITYDNTNSDIVDLMALPPSDRLDYMGNVSLNPNVVDIATEPNIISNTSRIDADIEIEIPLEFTATNLTLKDTIDDIDIDDADKIMNAAVVITAENGYPLDVTIESIQLTDAAFDVIDEITDNEVIDAASVYTSGPMIGEVDPASIKQVSHEIALTQSQIANLNLAENIIINALVSTENGGIPVKLKGDYELKFTISVQAQLDLSN